jgi:hypothetical protein
MLALEIDSAIFLAAAAKSMEGRRHLDQRHLDRRDMPALTLFSGITDIRPKRSSPDGIEAAVAL